MDASADDTLPPGLVLGRLEDCPVGRVVKFLPGARAARVIAIRRGDALLAYLNLCPHMGQPLDDLRDAILSADGQRFVCSAHNAAFSVETGQAVRGLPPECSLTPVPLAITTDGTIVTV